MNIHNELMIPYSPIVGNNHLKDQTLYTWRNGDIKKNTPVAWSISKVEFITPDSKNENGLYGSIPYGP